MGACGSCQRMKKAHYRTVGFQSRTFSNRKSRMANLKSALAHHPLLLVLVHLVFPRIHVVATHEVVQLKRLAQDDRLSFGVLDGLAVVVLQDDRFAAEVLTV